MSELTLSRGSKTLASTRLGYRVRHPFPRGVHAQLYLSRRTDSADFGGTLLFGAGSIG